MSRQQHVQASTKMVARLLLSALDDAARLVNRDDQQTQYFLEAIRDELAPQLKWAFRYGEWQLDAAPFVTDDMPAFEEADTEVDP